MPEPSTNSYRDAIKLSNMAVFEWDIREDSLHYDDMLPKLLLRELPRQGIRSFLENPRLIHPKERTDFKERVDFLLHGPMRRKAPYQDFNMDFRIHTTGRCYLWIHMAYRVHYEDGAALRVTGFLQNVNLIHQEKNRMQNLMERDPMTGLYSKTHSAYLVEQTVSSPEGSHALLVIDMDNFKQVNDKLGHLIGDAVILDVALNLKRLFRQADILGHIGGDEFMVLMKDISSRDIVQEKCRQLRELLRKSYTQGSETVSVSSSIGVALAPAHGTDYKTLFSHADAALYQGKKRGRDSHVFYDPSFTDHREKKEAAAEQNSAEYQKLVSNPLEYIFHTVMKSKDTSLAVQILLEIFAKHFNVHRAYVLWHAEGQFWAKALFDYAAKGYSLAGESHNPEVRRRMRKRYKDTNYGRFTECEDTGRLSESSQKVFHSKQIHAFLECAVMDEDHFLGCVGFDDCERPRNWSRAEHEVLHAFSEIMRRFLLGQMYYERMKKSSLWDF